MIAALLLAVPALLLACACTAPVAGLRGMRPVARGRREAALALHRAQLAALGRDVGLGLVEPRDAAGARLEIERRLLADAALEDAAPRGDRGDDRALLLAALAVPLAALALYLAQGHPAMPAQPLDARLAASRTAAARDAALTDELRQALATVDPRSDTARQGQDLLGAALAARGDWAGAAAAWRAALAIRFDAADAFRAAEAETRAEGRVGADAAALFRRALAAGPDDAPWRSTAAERLREAAGG